MKKLSLNDLLVKLPGIGPSTYFAMKRKAIETVLDLLRFYPIRYEDYSLCSEISRLQHGEKLTICAKVQSFTNIPTRQKRLQIQKASVADNSGEIDVVWFNQPYLRSLIKKGSRYFFSGTVDTFSGKLVFKAQEFEAKTAIQLHTGRIVPYYSEILKISSKRLRKIFFWLLNNLPESTILEYIPIPIVKQQDLLPPLTFFKQVHFPSSKAELKKAKDRLVWEELFFLLYAQVKQKKDKAVSTALCLNTEPFTKQLYLFKQSLPFSLTSAQEKSIKEIYSDLAGPLPMSRMLIGDVGSGKTIVAAHAIYLAFLNGFASIFMAPTEVLAQQHYETLKEYFAKYNLKIKLLTANQPSQKLKDFDLLIGTHAILYQKDKYKNIGLVIIDEQHKFGVLQRNKLISLSTLGGKQPHFLSLSATPIPRSLALVLHGSLELSFLDEKPQKRKKVLTYLVPEEKRLNGYRWIGEKIKQQGLQVYVICPLIEDSKAETLQEAKSVEQELNRLLKVYPDLTLATLHSKSKNKEKIINAFKNKQIQILISTSVVEVGIDVPGANIMIIEDADRFGLSQLHQLRGRIGRRGGQAYCFLFTKSRSSKTLNRLKILEKTDDGFKIAKLDLKFRGPGDLLGLEQHGFKNVSLSDLLDHDKISKIRSEAEFVVENYPDFKYNSLLIKLTYPDLKINLN